MQSTGKGNFSYYGVEADGFLEQKFYTLTLSDPSSPDTLLPRRDLATRIYQDFIQSGVIIITGPPGTGKTTLSRILATQFEREFKLTTSHFDFFKDVPQHLEPLNELTYQSILSTGTYLPGSTPASTNIEHVIFVDHAMTIEQNDEFWFTFLNIHKKLFHHPRPGKPCVGTIIFAGHEVPFPIPSDPRLEPKYLVMGVAQTVEMVRATRPVLIAKNPLQPFSMIGDESGFNEAVLLRLKTLAPGWGFHEDAWKAISWAGSGHVGATMALVECIVQSRVLQSYLDTAQWSYITPGLLEQIFSCAPGSTELLEALRDRFSLNLGFFTVDHFIEDSHLVPFHKFVRDGYYHYTQDRRATIVWLLDSQYGIEDVAWTYMMDPEGGGEHPDAEALRRAMNLLGVYFRMGLLKATAKPGEATITYGLPSRIHEWNVHDLLYSGALEKNPFVGIARRFERRSEPRMPQTEARKFRFESDRESEVGLFQ